MEGEAQETIWLELRAPFAAFRWLQAGVHRATSPVIPPSAAWGLVLNLAAIETRDSMAEVNITPVRPDAPPLELCIGEVGRSTKSSLLQQLHTYPVGTSGKEFKERTFGGKYWIAPVRREFLVDFHCVVGVRGPRSILSRVGEGLAGGHNAERYGLPFAGDNQLLFDRIDLRRDPSPARWYTPASPDDPPRSGSCRLTVLIDRGDSSRTSTVLFAPISEPTADVPKASWVWVPREPETA